MRVSSLEIAPDWTHMREERILAGVGLSARRRVRSRKFRSAALSCAVALCVFGFFVKRGRAAGEEAAGRTIEAAWITADAQAYNDAGLRTD
jgi:hypothetical protein